MKVKSAFSHIQGVLIFREDVLEDWVDYITCEREL